jgi:hypothetical protein
VVFAVADAWVLLLYGMEEANGFVDFVGCELCAFKG